jgi:hypothetical protein
MITKWLEVFSVHLGEYHNSERLVNWEVYRTLNGPSGFCGAVLKWWLLCLAQPRFTGGYFPRPISLALTSAAKDIFCPLH